MHLSLAWCGIHRFHAAIKILRSQLRPILRLGSYNDFHVYKVLRADTSFWKVSWIHRPQLKISLSKLWIHKRPNVHHEVWTVLPPGHFHHHFVSVVCDHSLFHLKSVWTTIRTKQGKTQFRYDGLSICYLADGHYHYDCGLWWYMSVNYWWVDYVLCHCSLGQFRRLSPHHDHNPDFRIQRAGKTSRLPHQTTPFRR